VLEDGELAEVTAGGIRVMRFDGTPVDRKPRRVEWDAAVATKGGYRHYLRKEIAEQPQAWIDTMAGRATAGSPSVAFEGEMLPAAGPKSVERIVMVGAGASWITSLVGKFIIEELCGVPVEVDFSGEFRYRRPPVGKGTILMAGIAVGRGRRTPWPRWKKRWAAARISSDSRIPSTHRSRARRMRSSTRDVARKSASPPPNAS